MGEKIYSDPDEWMKEVFEYELPQREKTLTREAWSQATKAAKMQEIALLAEIRELKKRLQGKE